MHTVLKERILKELKAPLSLDKHSLISNSGSFLNRYCIHDIITSCIITYIIYNNEPFDICIILYFPILNFCHAKDRRMKLINKFYSDLNTWSASKNHINYVRILMIGEHVKINRDIFNLSTGTTLAVNDFGWTILLIDWLIDWLILIRYQPV